MTTQKIIATAALILTFSIPSALWAESVNGADWYSMESDKTTNQIDQVTRSDSNVTKLGIGVDWHDGDSFTYVKHDTGDRSFSPDKLTGIGRDWYTEETTTHGDSKGECHSIAAKLNTGENNC